MEAGHRWDAATYHRASDVQEARTVALLERIELRGDETVLDAGCGSGRATERILERLPGGRVIAVDSSPEMVEHARRTLGDRATVLRADLTELELDEPVDVVVSNAAFHWVLDHERLFAHLYEALQPGGTLIASYGGTGNLDGFLALAATAAAEPEFAPHLAGYEPAWCFRGAEETEAILRAAGFSEVSAALDSLEEQPLDPAGYARTAPLLCYLQLLPPELHDSFVERVIERCGTPMRIDHVRLTIEARRPRTDQGP